ncbi:MAG TPA: helix-turn-helix transcriptional regulator [Jatrophihabitans sp.]|nr:helix-turn-helix transcriptional regulator [Jatrophihabitans sp.]
MDLDGIKEVAAKAGLAAKAPAMAAKASGVGSIGDFIREQRLQARVSLRQLAKLAGVSNPYLSQVERGLRKPSADILQQIAKGLRISAEQLYLQAGILEHRPGSAELIQAIFADPGLTERQKTVLIEIYQSFYRENRVDQDAASPAATPADGAAKRTATATGTFEEE